MKISILTPNYNGSRWCSGMIIRRIRDVFLRKALSVLALVVSVAQPVVGQTEDWTRWQQVSSLSAPRFALAAGALNGALYVVGGLNPPSNPAPQTNVYRYNGTNWTQVQGLPAPRGSWSGGVLGGALYAAGGFDSNGDAKTNMYRYNGTNWMQVQGLPSPRADAAMGVLQEVLYAVGGVGNSWVRQTNAFRYNGTNWTEVAGLPAPRARTALGTLNGSMYLVGGDTDGGQEQTNVYRFNGTTWMEVAGLPAARRDLEVGEFNGFLYAMGGANSTGYKTNVYKYDGTSWTEGVGLPRAQGNFGVGVLNGSLYVVGGVDNNGYATTNTYRYPAVISTCLATFDPQGGSVSPVGAIVTNGFAYGPLPTPARSGYVFAGWWTGVNGTGGAVTQATIVTNTINHSLYANWAAESLAIHPPNTNFNCAAWSGRMIGVTANVSWTAVSNVAWLAVTAGEGGTTNGAVTYRVATNAGATARTGGVVVAGGGLTRTCTVVQAAAIGQPAALADANFGVVSNRFGFNINWASGQVVVVDACSNLNSPAWISLQTNFLSNAPTYFGDSKWTNYVGRFYRLRSPE